MKNKYIDVQVQLRLNGRRPSLAAYQLVNPISPTIEIKVNTPANVASSKMAKSDWNRHFCRLRALVWSVRTAEHAPPAGIPSLLFLRLKLGIKKKV